jgi:hypothetical protein
MAVDGLAELRAQRSRRTAGRGLPAPQHPKAEPTPQRGPDSGKAPAVAAAQQPTPVVDVRDGPSPEPPTSRTLGRVETGSVAESEPPPAPIQRRSRVRATQVHLDQVSEDHLSELRKRAVLADVDMTQSAVLRLALAELVERHGYDRIVRMFAEDEPRIRRGRPRR